MVLQSTLGSRSCRNGVTLTIEFRQHGHGCGPIHLCYYGGGLYMAQCLRTPHCHPFSPLGSSTLRPVYSAVSVADKMTRDLQLTNV